MKGLDLIMAGYMAFTPVSAQTPAGAPLVVPFGDRAMPEVSAPRETGPVTCPAQKSARVDVRWRSEPVKYDNSQTYADLGNKGIDSKNPYGVHVSTDVGGLMTGKIQYKSGIQISSIRYPVTRQTCLWIDTITIDIVIDPLIQIAAENPPGSCKYIAILEHESKHVAIDRRVVQDHLGKIRLAASQSVQKVGVVGPKPDSTAEEFKRKMSAYIEDSLKVAVDAMYADRTARQQALDSREEYDRVQAQCPEQGQKQN